MTDALEVWAGELGARPPQGRVRSGAGGRGGGAGPAGSRAAPQEVPSPRRRRRAGRACRRTASRSSGGCSAGPGALCRGAPGSRLTPGSCPRREALRRGAVSLSLQEGGATLQLQGEAGHSTLHLCKLPVAEARTQLQALMFGLATSIKKLEERLEGLCVVVEQGNRRKEISFHPLSWYHLSPT